MKTLMTAATLAFALAGAAAPALAQPYGYGYRDGGYDRGYDYDRGSRYRDRDYDDRRDYRDGGYGRGGRVGFDSDEYLRCNPDVARAVRRGQMSSAIEHYRVFGRREGRRLSC